VLGAARVEQVAKILDLAGVLGVDADQHLHERGFAGAVFADQGVDLPLREIEVHLFQGVHTGKALVNPAHRENLRSQCSKPWKKSYLKKDT